MMSRVVRLVAVAVAGWFLAGCYVLGRVRELGPWEQKAENLLEEQTVEIQATVRSSELEIQAIEVSAFATTRMESRRVVVREAGIYNRITTYPNLTACLEGIAYGIPDIVGSTAWCIEAMFDEDRYVWGGPLGWFLCLFPGPVARSYDPGNGATVEETSETRVVSRIPRALVDRAPFQGEIVVSGAGITSRCRQGIAGNATVSLAPFVDAGRRLGLTRVDFEITAGAARKSIRLDL